jgi:predicted dehydrogenase
MIAGMRTVPGVEVAAIAEPDDDVFAREGSRYGLPRYRDWREMLEREKLHALGVVNIPGERASVVAECLRRGIHVLCDKPAAIDRAGLSMLRQANDLGRAILFPFFTVRYEPPVATAKRLVDEGRLGRLVSFTSFRPHKLLPSIRADWFWRRAGYGGVLVDLGIHDVDVFLWLSGAQVREVYASHANVACPGRAEFEDIAHMMIRADDPDIVGFFRTDWLTPDAEPAHGDCRYFLVGTEGTAEVRTTGGLPLSGADGGCVRLVTRTAPPGDIPPIPPGRTIFEDFARAAAGEPAAITARELFDANGLVLAGRESADQGVVVITSPAGRR